MAGCARGISRQVLSEARERPYNHSHFVILVELYLCCVERVQFLDCHAAKGFDQRLARRIRILERVRQYRHGPGGVSVSY